LSGDKRAKKRRELMSDLSLEEVNTAKKYLAGIRIWSWVVIVLASIIFIVSIFILAWTLKTMSILHPSPDVIYPPFIPISIFGIIFGPVSVTLYALAIVGINKRKRFSVKLIKTLLILTIFSIPIGTIIGALLLRRINNPLVKNYFDY
jgi:hypothetical protein